MKTSKVCSEPGCNQPYSAKGLCRKHYGRKQYLRNQDQYQASARERYWADRDRILASRRPISDEHFALLMEYQQGLCAICGGLPQGRKARLCVDHCHETGTIRGLLCDACNRGIGLLGDTSDRLLRAFAYLEGPIKVPPGVVLRNHSGTPG